jgi:predicted CopG family antitoxin
MPTFGTSIRVSSETYEHLNQQKSDEESFDDVLQRKLGIE